MNCSQTSILVLVGKFLHDFLLSLTYSRPYSFARTEDSALIQHCFPDFVGLFFFLNEKPEVHGLKMHLY